MRAVQSEVRYATQSSALLPSCGFVIRLIAVQAPVIIHFAKVIVP